MEQEAGEVIERIKFAFPSLRTPVERLSGGRQQAVAIARALAFDPKVLIMDEPTANLSPNASQRLLELVADLRNQGVSIIIISHRMQEIFDVGDRMSVLPPRERWWAPYPSPTPPRTTCSTSSSPGGAAARKASRRD